MKVSGSTLRLVERLMLTDREMVGRIIRRHYGWARRDVNRRVFPAMNRAGAEVVE